ncbi:deoxynucleoside kinase [Facklamia sp. 7083-14-GEN3]|uniref:deoxynucleoside kinase n=1 Tax=Facklamia sp. 7083-14-GEN3 TaxID=2973478 RepID=UPI00215CB1BF|nr:deoxynucleoside kinase [Facklamia sp. 7083-14-GEN3]MCR8968861.1 deoxynucleoside kinase [Facklamia sp. 7083-14-GEN3]
MAMIVIGGMIGAGKTSLATLLGKALKSQVYYENVDDNHILPLYYTASEEEQERKRYPFLLQLDFLSSRYRDIKRAFYHPHNIIDRSIYEDWYFAKINHQAGKISDEEFLIYEKLLDNMMEELQDLPKKAPDLMVYLHGSFECILKRINQRGREFEQDPELIEYYRRLWQGYDDWVDNHYHASQVLKISIDDFDVLNNPDDAQKVIKMVITKLEELGVPVDGYSED